jgi:hypothetical protein
LIFGVKVEVRMPVENLITKLTTYFEPGGKSVGVHMLKNTQLNEKATKTVNRVIDIFRGSYTSLREIH